MKRTLVSSAIAVFICLADANVHAASPAPSPTPDASDSYTAARARMVAKGRRMEIAGGVVSIAGSLSTLAVVVTDPSGQRPATTIPLISVGLVVAFTGLGVAIAGLRRRNHPEKFLRRTQLSAAPWGGRTGGGASIMLRF